MIERGIVIIPSWYPSPEDHIAGIFVQQQARALRNAGLNISIFYVEERRIPRWARTQDRIENQLPTFRIRAFVPPKRIKWLRFCWYRKWERLLSNYREENGTYPGLLHAHSFVGGAAARYLHKKYGIPYIITEHYDGFYSGKIPAHWRRELEAIYQDAAKVIAVSPNLAEALSAYVTRVEVIPNMIDTGLFRPVDQAPRSFGTRRIISVGSLIPRKNYETLLRVFAQFYEQEPLELVIIGAGPLDRKLKRLAARLKVDQVVSFMGSLTPAEVAAELQSAHLYVSVSRSESFALAPVEALACGLPVVMMPCGSILESRHFEGVTVVKEELDLKSAIGKQLNDLNKVNSLALHERMEAVFAPELIVKQLRGVYAEILAEGSA